MRPNVSVAVCFTFPKIRWCGWRVALRRGQRVPPRFPYSRAHRTRSAAFGARNSRVRPPLSLTVCLTVFCVVIMTFVRRGRCVTAWQCGSQHNLLRANAKHHRQLQPAAECASVCAAQCGKRCFAYWQFVLLSMLLPPIDFAQPFESPLSRSRALNCIEYANCFTVGRSSVCCAWMMFVLSLGLPLRRTVCRYR